MEAVEIVRIKDVIIEKVSANDEELAELYHERSKNGSS
nr:MAG TPA: hypothetical protein [Caudoviricetes sp.]